jgi:hypothetical protein
MHGKYFPSEFFLPTVNYNMKAFHENYFALKLFKVLYSFLCTVFIKENTIK